jgi:diaminopimelate epimerase
VDNAVQVYMPGGVIDIEMDNDYGVLMTGSVTKVSEGVVSPEIFQTPIPV